MKANELRIGNWVINGAGNIQQVVAIPLEYNEFNWFKPIPLTEEWLEKFGFEYDKVYYRHKSGLSLFGVKDLNLIESIELAEISDSFNTVAWKMGNSIAINGRNPRFQYVHQLQNLYFALNGEELQIKETINQ